MGEDDAPTFSLESGDIPRQGQSYHPVVEAGADLAANGRVAIVSLRLTTARALIGKERHSDDVDQFVLSIP